MLYAAAAAPPHPALGLRPPPSAAGGASPFKRRQLLPPARRPLPLAQHADACSPPPAALPGVSALLQPRAASAAGPRKRPLSGPPPAAACMSAVSPQRRRYSHAGSPPDRWAARESPRSPRSVYMNLLDPSATITPRGHPLHLPLQASRGQHGSPALGLRPHAHGSFPAPPLHRSASADGAFRLAAHPPIAGPLGPALAPAPATSPSVGPKPSRYLREMDRRVILARIDRGEKQSALAKEFQVSRAAICNLYKHREEVLSRRDGNPLAKHPKKPRPKAAAAAARSKPAGRPQEALKAAGRGPQVHELRSRAAALLLTTLRKRHTPADVLSRSAARLTRLVLEEALALVPLKSVTVELGGGGAADGVALEHPPCAVAVAAADEPRSPMLDVFADMEPEQPVGRVRFEREDGELLGDALPPTLGFHNVFLLEPVAASPAHACAAVRRLLERGAVEAMISLVALVVSQTVADALQAAFPAVRVVAAQVEPAEDEDASAEAAEAAEAFRRRLTASLGL